MIDELLKRLGLPPAQNLLLGNPVHDWLEAALLAAGAWLILWLIRKFSAARFKRSTAGSQARLLRLITYVLGNTTQLFFLAVSLYAALQVLNLPQKFERGAARAVSLLILLQVGFWAGRALRFYLDEKEAERGADHTFAGSIAIVNFIARVLIWSLLLLLALENLGVNITALLAGLGVGGVAVALALQNVLGDLFASLSIALDKPFTVGDSLTIDAFVGKVERIGIKTTRLRSESGEQIILSNADILRSRVRNFGGLAEQRVLTALRVAYDTPPDKLKALPALLENIVREQSAVRFERCHLRGLGESALLYELSFFVQQPAINSVLDIQQTVNFRIIDELRALGVEFAYPTQQLLIARRGEPLAD
jgi:small-conductance mechanosensitive channel